MSFAIGQRVAVSGRVGEGTVRFTGNTQFSSGNWIGIELDAADGRNNGSVNGVVYFECAPNHGVFARPDTVRAADAPLRRSRRGSASRDDATGSTTASLAVQGQQVGRDIAAAHQDIARLEAQLAGMRDVALPRAPAAAAPPRTVYAQEGSAIAASQARAGENSYYYSVGKNRAAGGAADPAPPPKPRAVAAAPSRLPEATIPSYSMVDDGALCKVLIPFAGAGALAAGALTVDFRDRSFDLRAVADGKVWRLHVPLLHEEINQHECGCRVRPGKLIVRLAKRDGSKGWYELRKTKGVGDTEWHKLVPDAGESVVVTI